MTTSTRTLAELRPPVEPFDPAWSAETLATILAQPVPRGRSTAPRTGRTRRRASRLVAAAALAGVVAVPTMLNSGGASARAELLHLATVVAAADAPAIAPGTYLHVKTESVQDESRILGDGQRRDTNRESWVRWDGETWAIDTRPSAGWTEHHHFPAPDDESFGTPTPEFVADLPDTAVELRTYLDDTVSGSNSHDEALFVAISDLASSRMLDPATFAVALQVLADVDGVETQHVVLDGRSAVEVRYDRYLGLGMLGRESFTVDRQNGQLLRAASSGLGLSYTSETTLLDVVDEVPAAVLASLREHGNGERICADGSVARDTTDPRATCR